MEDGDDSWRKVMDYSSLRHDSGRDIHSHVTGRLVHDGSFPLDESYQVVVDRKT